MGRQRWLYAVIVWVLGSMAGGVALAGSPSSKGTSTRIVLEASADAAHASNLDGLLEREAETVRLAVREISDKAVSVKRIGRERLQIDIPGYSNLDRVKRLLNRPTLSFQRVDDTISARKVRLGRVPKGDLVLPQWSSGSGGHRPQLAVRKTVLMTGERITSVATSTAAWANAPVIILHFDSVGTRKFGAVTAANVGHRLALVLNGTVVSAPYVREAIRGGAVQITGNFTRESAALLVAQLRAGASPEFKIIELRLVRDSP